MHECLLLIEITSNSRLQTKPPSDFPILLRGCQAAVHRHGQTVSERWDTSRRWSQVKDKPRTMPSLLVGQDDTMRPHPTIHLLAHGGPRTARTKQHHSASRPPPPQTHPNQGYPASCKPQAGDGADGAAVPLSGGAHCYLTPRL